MKKILIFIFGLGLFGLPRFVGAQTSSTTPTETPTVVVDGLEVEKLQLEIERLKLENQRLELQIQTIQMAPTPNGDVGKNDSDQPKKEEKKIAVDMKFEAEDLAKQNASDDHTVVLDFSNREIWYKGTRNKLDDFRQLCLDQGWNENQKFIKYDLNGDSLMRTQHQNMYLDRYGMQPRGVFVFEAPNSTNDFKFVSPEGAQVNLSFSELRNHFKAAYFKFDREDKDKNFRILRYKHSADFLGFDDVLEFWFDSADHFVKLKWGLLDKK